MPRSLVHPKFFHKVFAHKVGAQAWHTRLIYNNFKTMSLLPGGFAQAAHKVSIRSRQIVIISSNRASGASAWAGVAHRVRA